MLHLNKQAKHESDALDIMDDAVVKKNEKEGRGLLGWELSDLRVESLTWLMIGAPLPGKASRKETLGRCKILGRNPFLISGVGLNFTFPCVFLSV